MRETNCPSTRATTKYITNIITSAEMRHAKAAPRRQEKIIPEQRAGRCGQKRRPAPDKKGQQNDAEQINQSQRVRFHRDSVKVNVQHRAKPDHAKGHAVLPGRGLQRICPGRGAEYPFRRVPGGQCAVQCGRSHAPGAAAIFRRESTPAPRRCPACQQRFASRFAAAPRAVIREATSESAVVMTSAPSSRASARCRVNRS